MVRFWIATFVLVVCIAFSSVRHSDAAAPSGSPATGATTSSAPATLPVTFLEIEEEVPVPPRTFVEDANLRILGMSPRQMLWIGSIVCVVIMVLGTIATIRLSKKAAN